MYDNVATKKQFKKDKLPCGIKEDMFRKYASKETEKMFTQVDVNRLVSDITKMIPDKDIKLQAKMKSQLDYLGYIDIVIP